MKILRPSFIILFFILTGCRAASGPELLRLSSNTVDHRERVELAERAIQSGSLSQNELAAAYNNRCWGLGQLRELDEAVEDCTRALEISPNLEWAYINRAFAYNQQGQYYRAISDSDRAIELNPDNAVAWVNRGFAWNQLEIFDKALTDSEKAVALDPNNAAALINRGHARHEMGDYQGALDDCNRAVIADPNYTLAFNSLAFLLATCPDKSIRNGDRAVRLAEKALAMDPGDPMIWDTLAMSYAEAGMIEKAIETQKKAIRLLDEKGTPKEKMRREAYVRHLAYLIDLNKNGFPRRRESKTKNTGAAARPLPPDQH